MDSIVKLSKDENPENYKARAAALCELSQFCWASEADSAIRMSHQIIEIGEIAGDNKVVADGYFSLAMVNYVSGSFGKGYANFKNSYTYYDSLKFPNEYANAIYQSGICLKNLGQYENSIDELKKCYEFLDNNLQYSFLYSVSNELGELHDLIESYQLALFYFKKALNIAVQSQDTSAMIQTHIDIGCHFQDQSEIDKSILSFNQAQKLTHPSDKDLNAQIHIHLGESYLNKYQLEEAEQEFNMALMAGKEGDLKVAQSKAHFSLSKLYEIKQKYALALIEYKLFSQINDSLNAVLKTQTISDLQAKYDNASKDKELAYEKLSFEKQQRIDEQEREIQKQQQLYLIIGLIIIAIFLLLLFVAFGRQKKLNNELDKLSIVAREIDNTVIITDKLGQVIWINESYTKKYGLNIKEFKSRFGNNILENPPNDEVRKKIEECRLTKKTVEYYLSRLSLNRDIVLKTSLTPKLNSEGAIENFILIDTEVTELFEAEEKITSQRDKLQSVYTLLTESIDYAKRIQHAILPHREKIYRYFDDYYLLYHPKDVVSGDFYFIEETDEYVYVAGADCTGHGVPGALMSVICHNLLENSVHRNVDTDDILMDLNNQLIKKLRQQGATEDQIKDGLDITLCRIEKTSSNITRKVQISAAQNPAYIVSEGELTQVKADRIHLGRDDKEKLSITKHDLELVKGSELILFSDGFPDQKGGANSKKFYYQPFRDLIVEAGNLEYSERSKFLLNKFSEWKGDKEQADDVFILGLKI